MIQPPILVKNRSKVPFCSETGVSGMDIIFVIFVNNLTFLI